MLERGAHPRLHDGFPDDGGRLQDVGPVPTREALAELVATMIFNGSAQHSAVNFSWGDPQEREPEVVDVTPD